MFVSDFRVIEGWLIVLRVHQGKENPLLDRGKEPRERPDCRSVDLSTESRHETGPPAALDRRALPLPCTAQKYTADV